MQNKLFLPAAFLLSSLFLISCESESERYCFTVSDRAPVAGSRVTFNGTCSEGVELYHWNFGDGKDTVTRSATVEHAYEHPGTYEISLHSTTPVTEDHCPPNAGANGARQTIEVK